MTDLKYEAYCFKCKTKREVQNGEIGQMKTGMKTIKGTCAVCGGKVYKILPKDKNSDQAGK